LRPSAAPSSAPLDKTARLALAASGMVWLCAVFGGGSARADIFYVIVPRLAAVGGLLLLLLMVRRDRLRLSRAPLVFASLAFLVIGLQLVPLPHDLWAALPGRSPYDALAQVPEIGELWRPISLSPDLTWNALLSLLPPFFFLVAIPALNRRQHRWMLSALLATVLLSALIGLFQLAGGPATSLRWYPVTNVDSAVGFFANRNHQAVFLAMGIPLATWWGISGDRRLGLPRLAVAGLAILFLLVAVVTSQSRMGLAIAALSTLLSAIYFLREARLGRKLVLTALIASAIVGALGTAGLARWSEERLSVARVENDLRLRILPESLEAASIFFPIGSGFGSFPNVFRRFESVEDLSPRYVNHTHSEVSQIVIEGGLFSVLLLALFLGWHAVMSFRAWRPNSGENRAPREARLCSILVLLPLVGSISDYPLRTPLMACAFAVAAIILHLSATAARRRAENDGERVKPVDAPSESG
jgi:multisubunit Na+/H+ antiporter MnhF subunit